MGESLIFGTQRAFAFSTGSIEKCQSIIVQAQGSFDDGESMKIDMHLTFILSTVIIV